VWHNQDGNYQKDAGPLNVELPVPRIFSHERNKAAAPQLRAKLEGLLDPASLSALPSTTPPTPVQTGRVPHEVEMTSSRRRPIASLTRRL
jgi:hypothetical protein